MCTSYVNVMMNFYKQVRLIYTKKTPKKKSSWGRVSFMFGACVFIPIIMYWMVGQPRLVESWERSNVELLQKYDRGDLVEEEKVYKELAERKKRVEMEKWEKELKKVS